MEVFIIKKGDDVHRLMAAIKTSNYDVEVVVKKLSTKPSNTMISAYWSKLRKVSLYIGDSVDSIHLQSKQIAHCDKPFDLSSQQFKEYFDVVMWHWATNTGVDMGVY